MKNWLKIGILAVLIIGTVMMSGCTSQTTTATVTMAPTSITTTAAPAIVSTPMVTTSTTTVTVSASQTAWTQFTIVASDPILHRWVRQYPKITGPGWVGYEFIFYPGGSLNYNYGTPKMTMSNIEIIPTYQASGTWEKTGNNTYLLHYLPLGFTGAQIIVQYTWVPATYDKTYGRTIPEHIVSQDEIHQYQNSARDLWVDEMMYPERAKID